MEEKPEALRLTAGLICSQVAECGRSLAASLCSVCVLPFRGQSTSKFLIRHHQTVWSQLCSNSYISTLGAQCNLIL